MEKTESIKIPFVKPFDTQKKRDDGKDVSEFRNELDNFDSVIKSSRHLCILPNSKEYREWYKKLMNVSKKAVCVNWQKYLDSLEYQLKQGKELKNPARNDQMQQWREKRIAQYNVADYDDIPGEIKLITKEDHSKGIHKETNMYVWREKIRDTHEKFNGKREFENSDYEKFLKGGKTLRRKRRRSKKRRKKKRRHSKKAY